MNNDILSKQKLLEDSVRFVNIRLQSWILSRVYVDGKIVYARLNKDSIPIIGINVSEKIELGIYDKHLEFTVANNKLIPTLPLRALCDRIG